MTHDEFTIIAAARGFSRVYFTKPKAFEFAGDSFGLTMDARQAFPFASSIVILAYPYQPFSAGERIPAYYPASNRAYHAGKSLIEELNAAGIRAEKANIPIKAQLLSSGIGTKCRNSLVSIEPFGTRIVFFALAVDGLPPLDYDENDCERAPDCGDCHLCMDACPTGAISRSGFDVTKCMRFYMNPARHPDWVWDMQRTYIGCEICQYACRRNAGIESTVPDENAVNAFDIKRLIAGDTAAARQLVGKNVSSNGKLTAEAIAFAARDGVFMQEIKDAADSPFEAVREAVQHALQSVKSKEQA